MLTIRLASDEDSVEVSALIVSSSRKLQSQCYTEAQIEGAIGPVFCVDPQLILDQTFYVVFQDDQLAGCGGWSFRRSSYGAVQASPPVTPGVDPAMIRAFFVHPDFARRGIGSLILRTCEDAARERSFTDAILCATLAGIPLYTKYGYKITEECEIPLPNGEVLPVAYMSKRIIQ